jgi:hypothetical protein
VTETVRMLLSRGYIHPAVAEPDREVVAERAARLEVAALRIGRDHAIPALEHLHINALAGMIVPGDGSCDAVE